MRRQDRKSGNGIKVFSFDVDGTLVSQEFANCVWLQGIPEAYAAKEGVSFEQAFDFVQSECDKIGENRIEWYRMDYWLQKFGLSTTIREELFRKYEGEIEIYEEVERVLKVLKAEGFELVVSSNAATEFIDFQIRPIKKFFSRIFVHKNHWISSPHRNPTLPRICEKRIFLWGEFENQ